MAMLNQIPIFVTVVESGNFSLAAKALGITPVAVSKKISQLEADCQQPLFHRSTREMSLTSFGEEYYAACKEVMSAVGKVDLIAESSRDQLRGKLQICAPPIVAGHFLVPLVKKLKKTQPELEIEFTATETLPDMSKQNIDLLVGYHLEFMQEHKNLRYCPLLKVDNVLVASPHYLESHGTPNSIEELRQHSFICHTFLPKPFKLVFSNGETITDMKVILRLGDPLLLRQVAIKGGGIVYTGKPSVNDLLFSRDLVQILPSYSLGQSTIAAFYKSTHVESPKVRFFLDRLQEVFSS